MSDFPGRRMYMPRTRVMKKIGIAILDTTYQDIVREMEERNVFTVSECIRLILVEYFLKKKKQQ